MLNVPHGILALVMLALAVLLGAELVPGRVADAIQIVTSILCLMVGVTMIWFAFAKKA